MSSAQTRLARGFTLIEVLVAMAVLAVGLLAMTPLVSLSIQRGTYARKLSSAQQLAQELMERLRVEIRYDAEPAASAFTDADAWKYNVLPHAPGTDAVAACQPAGQDDGFAYHYGPYVFTREDQQYRVCYSVTRIDTNAAGFGNLSPKSVQVRMRVLWPSLENNGWSSWSMTDLLVSAT